MRPKAKTLLLAPAFLLAGCTVGPNYRPPSPQLASAFSSAKPPAAAEPGDIVPGADAVRRWWETFDDPELTRLIARALEGNRDLALAASRVRQARLQRATIRAGAFPGLSLAAGVNHGRGSENVKLPFGGGSTAPAASSPENAAADTRSTRALSTDSTASAPPIPTPTTGSNSGGSAQPAGPASPLGEGGLPGITTTLYQAGFDASWEFDLFGGTRRALEAGDALIAAAEEDRRAVVVSLLAEVAQTYLQLRSSQQRLQVAREGLAAARHTLSIAEAKFKNGLTTDLDVAQYQGEVANAASTLPPLEAATRLAAHALATLVGEPPDALLPELASAQLLPPLPASIPVGIPSDLLRRRPDVRSAERQLAAATAGIGVATADLFPHFSLTGAFGFDSSRPRDLPEWSSHYYSIIPGVRWPLLDWGRARLAVALQNETQRQALTRYESAVTQALRDVEDALVRYAAERTRHAALVDAASAADRAYTLARNRFEHGIVDALVVLDAQRSYLRIQDTLAASEAALRTDLVSLYKALGGGWEPSPAALAKK